MCTLIFIPFLIQAIVIGIDEGYFHLKRGLPRWERIGHPLDTLSVLICFVFVFFAPFSSSNLKVFVALAIFSCLMVTKDEFVHKHHCPASEHWLHALLFLNHPVMLASLGLMWSAMDPTKPLVWFNRWLTQPKLLTSFLMGQMVLVSLFFLYQVIYWNFIWKEKTS